MRPKEIFKLVMEGKEVPRVPYIETSIAFNLSESLLGRKLRPVKIPQLGLKARNVEDEKELSRMLGRDEISIRFTAPTFCEKLVGADGALFPGEGYINSMNAFQEHFNLPDPDDDSLYDVVREYVEAKEEFPVVFSTRLGFLSAFMSIGFERLMMAMYEDHELIDAVMGAYVDWSAKVIRRVIDMGVDCIKTTDDFAFNTGPFMSPAMFRQWVAPYHERAYKEINVPWILHTDGLVDVLLDDIYAMGFNALHPIDPNCYDIREFKKKHGHRSVIIGNVDLNNLGMGTPESVAKETKALIRDLGPGYGWCLSASNSVPDYVKPENLLCMAKTLQEYGKYPVDLPEE